jgi:hypothetical protein
MLQASHPAMHGLHILWLQSSIPKTFYCPSMQQSMLSLQLATAGVRCGSPCWRCRCSPPMGGVGYHNPPHRRGLTRCIGAAVPRLPDHQRRGVSGA